MSLIAARPLPTKSPTVAIAAPTTTLVNLLDPSEYENLLASSKQGVSLGGGKSVASISQEPVLKTAVTKRQRIFQQGGQVHAAIPGNGPYMSGTLVAQTQRLDLYVGSNTFSAEQIAANAPLLEQLLRESERRLGTTLEHRISLAFYRSGLAPIRGVRGMAYTDSGQAEIYYQAHEDINSAITVAVHEIAHHLEEARYGHEVQRRADTILHEGFATWITGPRWLEKYEATTWKERAQHLRDAGIPLRLLSAEHYGANNAYELWASFCDFLIERYGIETFDALYSSGRGRAHGSSDYQGITGKTIDELAEDWRIWLSE